MVSVKMAPSVKLVEAEEPVSPVDLAVLRGQQEHITRVSTGIGYSHQTMAHLSK